ncbi:armadillo-type protein [Obelidium mucronatum]|nr:armadillo-type protein [Obelidium mucronatum]
MSGDIPALPSLASNASVLTLTTADSASDLLQTTTAAHFSPLKSGEPGYHNTTRRILDSDSDDSDDEKIGSTEELIAKLNSERAHRGPQAKAKPRKKGIDVENEMEVMSRKLLNVGIDENAVANAIPEAQYYLPNDPTAIRYLLPTHASQVISALNHEVLDYVLNAMKQIRRYMCVDDIPDKTERVLDLKALPRIRELLLKSNHLIQYEGSVVNYEFIPPLIHLLRSSGDQVRVQAAWALGNVAGDCKEYTQILLDHGIMEPLLEIPYYEMSQRKCIQARHVVCWVIANLCRWDNRDWSQVEPCFPLIQDTVLNFRDEDVMSEAMWALSRIFHGKNPGNSKLVQVPLIRKLVSSMQSSRANIQTPVLRVMTNISGESKHAHTDVLIQAGILDAIYSILISRHVHIPQVIIEVLHCLSNITAGTPEQKEAVNRAGLFEPVREVLMNSPDVKAKKEALHVLRNAVDRDATPEHFRDVVGPQGEIFAPLTKFLAQTTKDLDIQLEVIETLNIIFSRGDEPLIRNLYPFAIPGTNVYVTCMNYISQQNFKNIWEACMVTEQEVKARTDIDEETKKGVVDAVVGHFRPGLTSSDIVKTEKLKKAISRDMGMMMDLYLSSTAEIDIGSYV